VPGGSVLALLAEGNRLWVGTGGGLARINDTTAEKLRLDTYNTARGLASNSILCVVADLEGRIYAGTAKGVDRIEPNTGISAIFRARTDWRTGRSNRRSAIGTAPSGLRPRRVCPGWFRRRIRRRPAHAF